MAILTDPLLAELKAQWLPADAATNGWDDNTIRERWTGGIATTVRRYWFERVSDTAGYLDVPDPGGTLPITQIHRQAKEMLQYWDDWIAKWGDTIVVTGSRATKVGKIKKRYQKSPGPHPTHWNANSPYNPAQ
ncbi:hypothetical protein SEA_LEOPARD_13 [Mycobacterium phage Leopard]|uniref:Uncharacterized protein n=1 Tax=Mycobacterium phage Onyinye TaxID=2686235 RepID=A0A6B9L7E4_9CAUD|nr:hypothetical protein PP339_gp014 [Mycobacterium phage Onyinye]QHB37420.1 hypothetical protein SEA_ONYINYE_14 [Mycobacterium phage Onyinye]UOW92891.1 hypothetical protein SEA_LEOPARD_13 [Mycobacterium phage Leopard]WKW85175.1 hypothetical protein SEA_AIKOY__13 [Mycobacterium phage Aikoy]